MTDLNKEKRALNDPMRDRRLLAAGRLSFAKDAGLLTFPPASSDVNSHIHTTYSFSPYTPSAAVLKSLEAGLATCGIMDHDSVSGAEEFRLTGAALGIKTTVGCEIRVSFRDTFLKHERINNPDQKGIAYVALHGIPEVSLPAVRRYLKPIRAARNRRNRAMTEKLAALLLPLGIAFDFDDVTAVSLTDEGGAITERHLLYAAVLKLAALARRDGTPLSSLLETLLGFPLDNKQTAFADDVASPHRLYDVLGLLKSHLVERIYADADAECPPVKDVVAFSKAHGLILAYPYLGDVAESVTGDKKAQTFEDSYLDMLIKLLADLGIEAITFMPSRNTRAQLERLMRLAAAAGFFQISGEDINQPRQPFVCEAMRDPMFDHLRLAAHALIGHERAAAGDVSRSFLSEQTKTRYPDLNERIRVYAGFSEQGGPP